MNSAINRSLSGGSSTGPSSRPVNRAPLALMREAGQRETLTLVLGAGASAAFALPIWSDLVAGLLADAYEDDEMKKISPRTIARVGSKYPPAVVIRHLENKVSFPSTVRELLRERLYSNIDETGASFLVEFLCQKFLIPTAPMKVREIITYNFDNLLERHLKRSGVSPHIAWSDKTYPNTSGGLAIHHPHGYLPHPDDDLDDDFLTTPVVFSERQYNLHYMDMAHWSSVVQLHHFMNRNCLFLGISFADPNLRRLLDHSRTRTGNKTRHAAIYRAPRSLAEREFLRSDLTSLGVEPIWVKSFSEIPRVIVEL